MADVITLPTAAREPVQQYRRGRGGRLPNSVPTLSRVRSARERKQDNQRQKAAESRAGLLDLLGALVAKVVEGELTGIVASVRVNDEDRFVYAGEYRTDRLLGHRAAEELAKVVDPECESEESE